MLRGPASSLRRALLGALLVAACSGSSGPGPQQTTFPPGQRVTRGHEVAVELLGARYELDRVELQAKLSNRGTAPLTLDREGILLEYGELEFPLVDTEAGALAAQTTVPPGEAVELTLAFVTEQALVEAATLHLLSMQRGPGQWVEPLALPVPPSAAFVDAAQPTSDEP